ncbi:hypothetical protein GCM10025868_10230 [Angustibacter aerolatus]|uniref:Major facilitator superfamily (MFS) profile domain-containing protein n=1 Tax=Angustibacter aerolatus TaxID=1162965 RepID=A0ABQ6JEB7_9ACTN|nr:hypothetical protein GCM10025868_10230 [Angustibacter aerolatus]
MLRAAGLVGGVGLLLVVLARGPAVAVAGFGLTGLGLAVVAPLAFATTDRLPDRLRDTAIARLNLANYVGVLAGGAVVGALGTAGSLRAGYLAPLVAGLAVTGLAPAFAARRTAAQEAR